MSDHGNLSAWIFESARRHGDAQRPALTQGERSVSYASLEDTVAKLAGALRELGLVEGERVAIVMRDTIEAVTSILGVIHCGGVAVPLSELATADDLVEHLVQCEAAMVIVDPEHREVIDSARAGASKLRHVLALGSRGSRSTSEHDLSAQIARAAPIPAVVRAATAPCLMLYSAGPALTAARGIGHSAQTIAAAHDSAGLRFLEMGPADRVLSVARLSTAYGLGVGLLFPLAAGAQVLMFPAQPKSESLYAAIAAFGPTLLFATPSIYGQLVQDAGSRQRPLAGLRAAVAGAESMPDQLIPRIRSVLGTEVTVGYGLTEIFQFALGGRSDDPGIRAAVCGRPLPDVETRLVDEDGRQVGVDEIGTLQLRSPSLAGSLAGSLAASLAGSPGASLAGSPGDHEEVPAGARGLGSDGWFTTGDRFMVDTAGNYSHCGRVDDLFKVGGKWVSPVEVERALTAHEAVWECAVIGAQDEHGLIKPLAFVVPNVGHAGDAGLVAELQEYVKQVLAPYKYPRWIEFVDALPRGPGGKVLRYRLQPRRRRRPAETGQEDT